MDWKFLVSSGVMIRSSFLRIRENIAKLFQNRPMSAAALPVPSVVNYVQLAEFSKKSAAYVIDVREKSELAETGELPNSVNIPVGDIESALQSDAEEFEKKYGRKKPELDSEIVFSCKMGGRSEKATRIAASLGYRNIYNYAGGWLDWEKNRNN